MRRRTCPPSAPPAGRDEAVRPVEVRYLPGKAIGVVALRPAAIARRAGMDALHADAPDDPRRRTRRPREALDVDGSRPGFVNLRCEDVESIVVGVDLGRAAAGVQDEDGRPLHTLTFGGLTVRTVAPFDWRAFFHQWNLELVEVQEPRGAYYKVKDSRPAAELLFGCDVYLPDDRTLVLDGEETIKALIAREEPSGPDFLRGADWEQASRGVLAVAFDNRDDAFIGPMIWAGRMTRRS